jgi:ATP-binding cassette subfamily B protein
MAQANTTNQKDSPKPKRIISLKDLWPFLKPYRL